MATSTRWAAVMDALVSLSRGMTGYRDPGAAVSAGLRPVFDSILVGGTEDHASELLVVGWSGDPTRTEDAGESGQATATLGNRGRDESGRIKCLAQAWSGAVEDVAAVRGAAFDVLGDVEELLRTNPTLGLDQAWMRQAELGEGTRVELQQISGVRCRVEFSVTYRARI